MKSAAALPWLCGLVVSIFGCNKDYSQPVPTKSEAAGSESPTQPKNASSSNAYLTDASTDETKTGLSSPKLAFEQDEIYLTLISLKNINGRNYDDDRLTITVESALQDTQDLYPVPSTKLGLNEDLTISSPITVSITDNDTARLLVRETITPLPATPELSRNGSNFILKTKEPKVEITATILTAEGLLETLTTQEGSLVLHPEDNGTMRLKSKAEKLNSIWLDAEAKAVREGQKESETVSVFIAANPSAADSLLAKIEGRLEKIYRDILAKQKKREWHTGLRAQLNELLVKLKKEHQNATAATSGESDQVSQDTAAELGSRMALLKEEIAEVRHDIRSTTRELQELSTRCAALRQEWRQQLLETKKTLQSPGKDS